MRTRFEPSGGEPIPVLDPESVINLAATDLRHLPESEREAEALRLARVDSRRTFDLSRGPLVHSHLLKLDDTEHLLIFCTHHIAFDGWSAGLLRTELAALYDALSRGLPPPLPDLAVRYSDYAHWQRNVIGPAVLERDLPYWLGEIKGSPTVLDLPTDRPRGHIQGDRGGLVIVSLPASLTEDLRSLARGEGATLFMTLLTAFHTLLHRYTQAEDILVGCPVAGRRSLKWKG